MRLQKILFQPPVVRSQRSEVGKSKELQEQKRLETVTQDFFTDASQNTSLFFRTLSFLKYLRCRNSAFTARPPERQP